MRGVSGARCGRYQGARGPVAAPSKARRDPANFREHSERCLTAARLWSRADDDPHQETDDVRRAYIHAAEYWPERVKMMQSWADYLDELREGGKVLPLTRRAKKATV